MELRTLLSVGKVYSQVGIHLESEWTFRMIMFILYHIYTVMNISINRKQLRTIKNQ